MGLVAVGLVAAAGCGGSDNGDSTAADGSLNVTLTAPPGIATTTTTKTSPTSVSDGGAESPVPSAEKQKAGQRSPAAVDQSPSEIAKPGAPTSKAGPSAAAQAAQGAQSGNAGPAAESLK